MISTNDNVRVETFPRKAGVESGRLFNDWLDCRFVIQPATSTQGFHWTVFYKATDTASDAGGFPVKDLFAGFAPTRAGAHRILIDVTTRRIRNVIEARKRYIRRRFVDAKLSLDDGIRPLFPPARYHPTSVRSTGASRLPPVNASMVEVNEADHVKQEHASDENHDDGDDHLHRLRKR